MTIQTATNETFQARLEADDQGVLWLLDAEPRAVPACRGTARRLAHRRQLAGRADVARRARVRERAGAVSTTETARR